MYLNLGPKRKMSAYFPARFTLLQILGKSKKSKAIPVTGLGGL
jgi:hypothetical protein